MAHARILVVDDEKEIAELIKDYLVNEGYTVVLAYDGEEALQKFNEENIDLVLLDIMIPKIEGTEVCRIIRNNSLVPIIMLSAKKEDIDKILSLGLGADDYVTKPFSPSVLMARIKAHLRREQLKSIKLSSDSPSFIKIKDIEIDIKGFTVKRGGVNINFTTKEFKLLELLVTNPNQVISREQIFNYVWNFDDYGDVNTVTVHIRKIREKLEDDPANPKFIKTIWGIGYKFEV